jgi:MtN3 and saliva related transmembrane protein
VNQDAVGLVAATLTTIAYVPQIRRIVKTRSAHDISWWMFGIMTAGASLWLVWGVAIGATPVIAANVVTLALLALILVLKWRYGRDATGPGR